MEGGDGTQSKQAAGAAISGLSLMWPEDMDG